MTVQVDTDLAGARAELAAAHAELLAAVEAPWEDDTTNERMLAALGRLRLAQARHTAARSGLTHLPDLIGHG